MRAASAMYGMALCASVASASPHYYAVHIDHLDPAKAKQFEDARREWVRLLTRQRLTDGRGFFWQDGVTFLTLNAFESFADLETKKQARAQAQPVLDHAAQARYDRLSDETLVFPHTSEIWSHEEALDYTPSGPPLSVQSAPFAKMVTQELRPTPVRGEQQYELAWKQVREALLKANYPLTRETYFSAYGSGKLVSFWLGSSPEAIERAPSVEQAVTMVLGAMKARELLGRLNDCALKTQSANVVRRTDLDSPK